MSFSNSYDTTNPGSAVGNREQLLEGVSQLEPQATPIYSLLPKSKATSTFVEWTVDKLDDPVSTGIREGADVSSFDDKFAGRARLGNYIQHQRRTFKVSKLQEAVSSVGPADVARAQAKAVLEIKRDIEKAVASGNDRAAEDGVSTGYQSRGLDDWLDSAGPSDVPSSYRTPAASIHSSGTFDEDAMGDVIRSIFTETGDVQNLSLVADVNLRKTISQFTQTGAATDLKRYNSDAKDKEVILSVDVYESDHGIVSIVNANPTCMPDTVNLDYGYFLNPAYAGIAELLPMTSYRLEDQGGGPRGYVDCAWTLLMKHPQAHGKVTVLS